MWYVTLLQLQTGRGADWLTISPDIRDLITLEDVMEELKVGPNGGLVYCMEFLLSNLDWLESEIGEDGDEYILFDCPGKRA